MLNGYNATKRVMMNNGWEFNETIKEFWNAEAVFKDIT